MIRSCYINTFRDITWRSSHLIFFQFWEKESPVVEQYLQEALLPLSVLDEALLKLF